MGLLQGAIAFRSYRVFGDLPENAKENLLILARRYVFRGFRDETDDRAIGFIPLDELLDEDISYEQFFSNNYVVFSLRRDSRAVAKNVLRAYTKRAVREFQEKHNLESVSRLQRKEIEEVTHLKLLKEVFPKIASYDVCWNLDTGMLFFFNTGNSINDEFLPLFRKAFSLELLPLTPTTTAKLLNPDAAHTDATLLGQEFLTWLLYVVTVDRARVTGEFDVEMECWLEDSITLKGRETENSYKGGASQQGPEAKISLLKGQLVARLRIGFKYNDMEWLFTLTDSWFDKGSVKIPAVLSLESDDKFYERISHVEEVQRFVDTAFRVFLDARTDEASWQRETDSMKAWFGTVNLDELVPELL